MAQLNITLCQDEILQLLSDNREDAFKTLLTESLNSILQAESAAQIGAEPAILSQQYPKLIKVITTTQNGGVLTNALIMDFLTIKEIVYKHRQPLIKISAGNRT